MNREIKVEEVENGFILTELHLLGHKYLFTSFKEMVEWIEENYSWKDK